MVSLAMPKSNNSIPTLGILGGGQLGRMLIQEALNWNVPVHVLDPDPECPCAHIASNFVCGDFRDYETVLSFCRDLDFITIEIEQVNTEALKRLEQEGLSIYPQPSVVEMIKDKALQKAFYQEHNIPSSEFRLIDSRAELQELPDEFFPCFQKSRRDGYDGKGVLALTQRDSISSGFDLPSIVEKAVDVRIEFALFGAGDGRGNCVLFPPVEMEFNKQANLVQYLITPANLEDSQLKKAESIVKKIFEKTSLRGLLAVEFFLSKGGEILVNEMAPRPHNSGHTTIEGNYSNQFAEHLRAVLGWPAGDTSLRSPSVMINLLGWEGYEGTANYTGLNEVLAVSGAYLHLYGKSKTKAFRKMGHITVLGTSREDALKKADSIKNSIKITT
jgi:5-(carboxyamino)imidazole ribonucleotide synthase